MDEMTSKERIDAIRRGNTPDRLPIRLMFNSAAGVLCNMSFAEAFSSAKKYAECQIAAYRRYGCDGISASYSMHGIGIALGAEVVKPENGNFFIKRHPIQNLDDFSILDLEKVSLKEDKLAQQAYEVVQRLQDALGKEVGIGISFPGPATAVVSLIGMENFLRWLGKYPHKMTELLEFSVEAVKLISTPFLDMGIGIGLSDPAASGMILGEKRYRNVILPYTKQIFQYWNERGQKVRPYHVCGNTTNILTDMGMSGATSVSIDNQVSLLDAKKTVGKILPISGNIDPVSIIKDGSKEEMENAIKQAYAECYDSPKGFTLSPGCGIPVNTSIEQIDMFVEIAKIYARRYANIKI